jgi:hopanoid biosynthesis associated protein HpnK
MRRLIVNADDFGLTEGVNRAVLEAHRQGVLTSASLLANGPAFDDAVEQARGAPALSVGAHLNLTEGIAVAGASASSLTAAGGRFAFRPLALAKNILAGRIARADVECELRAQIEKILGAGVRITHLDGHKHVHVLPVILDTVVKLAREYGIPWVRCPAERASHLVFLMARQAGHRFRILKQYGAARALAALAAGQKRKLAQAGLCPPPHFFGITPTGFLDRDCLVEILARLPEGTSELMCHPGYADAELEATPTRLLRQREIELEALTRPEIKHLVAARGIELMGYDALGASATPRVSGGPPMDARKLQRDAVKSA